MIPVSLSEPVSITTVVGETAGILPGIANTLAPSIKILIIQIIKINRNTNMQEVMNLGYKTSGKVLSVEYFNKRVYKGRIERYSLVVQYVDIDGILKKFETVPLAIVPKSGYSIICDVFIYNNKCYAYNFKNFHIDRNVDKERKIEMIVIMSIAFILGITAILLC